MAPRELSTVLTDRHFLECPRWHDGRVWTSDFYAHEVISCREDGSDLRVEAAVPGRPSGLGWLPDGRLLVASMTDARILRRETDGSLAEHADLGAHVTGLLNDMVVDEAGRAYVGHFGFDLMGGGDVRPASVLLVDADGSVSVAADDLWFPNGTVLTGDGRLLVDETFGNRVSAFDVDADGRLGPRRDWAVFGPAPQAGPLAEVLPRGVVAADGNTYDAEGMVWLADALHGRVLRVREGGEIVDEISIGTGAFACGLGGEDGRTLFVCAAPDFLESNRSVAREATLLAVRVDVPHAGRP